MKSIIIYSCFLLTFGALASNNLEIDKTELIVNNNTIEYKNVSNLLTGEDVCYARFCWNTSETTRQCTEWQEIPCGNPTIEIEGDRIE